MRVLGLGAAGDPPLFVQNAPEVKSKVGKYPLVRSMGAVLASDLHLAADTGTGHVAAAYGVPVVSVFSKNDPQRFRPYAENAKVLRHGKEAARVRSAEVVEAAHQLLQEKQRALFD
jgi:ADP-heptose:LPS heptosyltransferase